MNNLLTERITIDPNICHGKACIRGLRYPVEFVLELDDILAVLSFAIK